MQSIEYDHVGVVILKDGGTLKEGDLVHRAKKSLSVPVGKELLGRVVKKTKKKHPTIHLIKQAKC